MKVGRMMTVGADRGFVGIVFEVGAAAAAAAAAGWARVVGIAADCQLQVASVVGLDHDEPY